MADIKWIGKSEGERGVEDAIGYLAGAVEGARGVLVVTHDGERYHIRGFGEMLKSDTALVGALLSYEAARQMFEDD